MKITVRLEDDAYVSNYTPIQGVKQLTEHQLQQKMTEVARTVIYRVQEAMRRRVDTLELEFVQDSDKLLWLVNVKVCRLAVKQAKQLVGINRSVLSYQEVTELTRPAISITRNLTPRDTSSPDLTNHDMSSSSHLPLIGRIYQKLKEGPFHAKHKRSRRSMSTIELSTPYEKLEELQAAPLVSIPQAADSEEQPLLKINSAFKDLVVQYIGKDSLELLMSTTEETEVSPVKTQRESEDIQALAKDSTYKLPVQSSTKQFRKARKRRTLSSTGMQSDPMQSILMHAAVTTTSRIDRVIERLQTRHKELSLKYGSVANLQKGRQTQAKSQRLSPYAKTGSQH
jgi:hypothetical protein